MCLYVCSLYKQNHSECSISAKYSWKSFPNILIKLPLDAKDTVSFCSARWNRDEASSPAPMMAHFLLDSSRLPDFRLNEDAIPSEKLALHPNSKFSDSVGKFGSPCSTSTSLLLLSFGKVWKEPNLLLHINQTSRQMTLKVQ